MPSSIVVLVLALALTSSVARAASVPVQAGPVARDGNNDITYQGLERNGIELFLNIPYGQDTGGVNRFKPPRPHTSTPGTIISATAYGPACPQPLGIWLPPISMTNITHVSEDCLNLNIARPRGTAPSDKLPVLVFLHGGSFWFGSNEEITFQPDSLVLQSVENGLPVLHVVMNYRLGFFGFAQSETLRRERSENAGLRDQRLALEWVRDNIAHFGGDADKVTIFGQSSGGLSVGLHIMAYGGEKPVPFHRAIAQSQILEPGITGKFTQDAMTLLVDKVNCANDKDEAVTLQCLRDAPMERLLEASIATYSYDIAHNVGDIWLPSVDGDFLPAPPSQLIRERRFAEVPTMMGWCSNDVSLFTEPKIRTDADTFSFLRAYAPHLDTDKLGKLLELYPVDDFAENQPAKLSREFYRASRVFRDIFMTCEPLLFAEAMSAVGNEAVYLYEWNQSLMDPYLTQVLHRPGLGPVHTAEFPYIFGNFSLYDVGDGTFRPSSSDHKLRDKASRSWSTFAHKANPGLGGHATFQNFKPAFGSGSNDTIIYVMSGGDDDNGSTPIDGPGAHPAVASQRLRERCAMINSPDFIRQLRY